MNTPDPFRRAALITYVIPFLWIFILLSFDSFMVGLAFFSIFLAPALLYFFGVPGCRYVMGSIAAFSAALWLITPLFQHAIDRTLRFWTLWSVLLLLFIFASILCLRPPKRRRMGQQRSA